MAPAPVSSALATASSSSSSTSLSLQVRSPDDLQRLARLFSASGLFGRNQGNPDAHMAECAIKILAGLEAGFGSFASISGVSVINGRPGFGANLLAQAIKRHPLYDYRVIDKTDQACRIRFLAGKEVLGDEVFTIQMAERANLIGKGGPWKQYPEAMLFARCLSAGMRTHCPDALGGAPAYTPEELGAKGQIDENGVVIATVVEEPSHRPPMLTTVEELVSAAANAAYARGMTSDGLAAFIAEVSHGEATSLDQLPRNILARLAKNGVSPDTVTRCNAAGAPVAEVDPVVPEHRQDDVNLSDIDPTDDPDDLPAAWSA